MRLLSFWAFGKAVTMLQTLSATVEWVFSLLSNSLQDIQLSFLEDYICVP